MLLFLPTLTRLVRYSLFVFVQVICCFNSVEFGELKQEVSVGKGQQGLLWDRDRKHLYISNSVYYGKVLQTVFSMGNGSNRV